MRTGSPGRADRDCRARGGEDPSPGISAKDPSYPARRCWSSRHFERLDLVALTVERRREGVDDQCEHIGPHQSEHVADDCAGERRAKRDPVGAHKGTGNTEDRVPDQLGYGSDGGERRDVAGVERCRRGRLRVDDLPLGAGESRIRLTRSTRFIAFSLRAGGRGLPKRVGIVRPEWPGV